MAKQIKVIEEVARKAEQLQCEMLELRQKLKVAEYRGENEEMNIQRLNVRIDQVVSQKSILDPKCVICSFAKSNSS